MYMCICILFVQQLNEPALLRVEGLTLEPGRSCNDFEGYCSQQDRCIYSIEMYIYVYSM